MTKRNYISLIALLYMCGFGGILLFAGVRELSFTGSNEGISLQELAVLAAGSIFIAWIGTERLLYFNTPNSPRFLLSCFVHGLIVLTMLGVANWA